MLRGTRALIPLMAGVFLCSTVALGVILLQPPGAGTADAPRTRSAVGGQVAEPARNQPLANESQAQHSNEGESGAESPSIANRDEASHGRVEPERAVLLGLEGLRHLYPASDEREQELLNAGCRGAWTDAVVAYRAYAAPNEHRFDAVLCCYLIAVRAAGVFIEARKDGQLRAAAIERLVDRLEVDLAPLLRAALFDSDDAVVAEAIRGLYTTPIRDDAVIARLREIADGDGPNAEAAQHSLAFLLNGTPAPVVARDVPMGGGGGSGGAGGFSHRRTRGGGGHRRYDVEGYTVDDIAMLTERYRDGNVSERYEVARIVEHYLWPEALPLLKLILTDAEASIRAIGVNTAGHYGTDEALRLLVERFPDEPDGALQRSMVERVLGEDAPALLSTREEMFLLAIADGDTVNAALDALEAGRAGDGAAVVDALIVSIFRNPARDKWPLARAMRWLNDNANPDDLTRAVSDGFAYREEAGPATTLLTAIEAAFEAEPDAAVLPLCEIAFHHLLEPVRIAAVGLVVDRFGDVAVPILRERLLQDTDDVGGAVVDCLRVHVEDKRVLALLLDIVLDVREPVAGTICSLVEDVGDARYIALALALGERTEVALRIDALGAIVPTGDVRHVDEVVRWLADPVGHVVLQACTTALDIMQRDPADPFAIRSPWCAHRAIDDRAQLLSYLLARIAHGDLNMAVWIAERLPRLGWPDAHADFAPTALAAWLSRALQIPVATLSPEQMAAIEPVDDHMHLRDADDSTIRYVIPGRFYREIYRSVLTRVDEKPLAAFAREIAPQAGAGAAGAAGDSEQQDGEGDGPGGDDADGVGDRGGDDTTDG